MSEQEGIAMHDNETAETTVEEAVTEVTSADTTSVDNEVRPAPEETEQEVSETTEEVAAAEEEAPVAESNGDISFTDYIDNIPQLKKGATVKGVIVRYDDDNVYVDVKDKSEGKIARREFDNDPEFDLEQAIQNKTPIDVYVKSIRNTDVGKEILLSKARVDFAKYKDLVETAFNEKTPIDVKVVNVVKDGVIAAYGGVDIYIHRTQLDNTVVEDLEEYKGTELEILVTQFDPDRKRLRVSGSRRALLNRDRKARAEEVWSTIAVGDIYEGVVRNLTDFGAFVDIGGVDGLVHISELSWNRIKHASEVISVGDVIQVYVKDFDKEKKRISLGYKRIEDDPYHNIEERFPIGTIVHGKVVRMFNFGAFVEIAEGVDALCHISQISSVRLNKPGDVLKEGQEVDARVLEVSDEGRRISISIKDVSPVDELIGEAAEQQAKRQDAREKRNANRLPNSYNDSRSQSREPSDMEKAFAAARAAQEEAEGEAAPVADEAEDVTDEAEQTEPVVDTVEDTVAEDTTEVETEETPVEEVEETAEVEAPVEETVEEAPVEETATETEETVEVEETVEAEAEETTEEAKADEVTES